PVPTTLEANPGEVWEEDEIWIDLAWRIDPDGALGLRRYFESPTRPGERLTVDEQYGWLFEQLVPGLPARAAEEGLSPLAYRRRSGAFTLPTVGDPAAALAAATIAVEPPRVAEPSEPTPPIAADVEPAGTAAPSEFTSPAGAAGVEPPDAIEPPEPSASRPG